MDVRDIFVKRDERREQWRVQPIGWVTIALVAILVASLTLGVWRTLTGPRLRITPTVPPTAVAKASDTGPRPTATSIVRTGCPTDPALWKLASYSLPGNPTVLYTVDSCVVEQIEGAFCNYLDARAERGRRWTAEDDAYFRSYDGFKTILGGEELPPIPVEAQAQAVMCLEVSKDDGTPMTCADYHVVLYTMSEGGLTADLLVISDEPGTIRIYDCDTGELTQETYAADVGILYQPMLHDATANRWQVGYHYDVYDAVAPGEIDVQGMISLILDAQGRNGPQ